MWITHPLNTVRNNHCAGSDFYGMWYELKEFPDGPSATSEICPRGMPVGVYEGNVSHSNRRFGLRFFIVVPREKPCSPSINPLAADPFLDNPSIHTIYRDFVTFKNGECGVLAEEMGDVTFENFFIVDSYRAAF
jgi:hypothetical protein